MCTLYLLVSIRQCIIAFTCYVTRAVGELVMREYWTVHRTCRQASLRTTTEHIPRSTKVHPNYASTHSAWHNSTKCPLHKAHSADPGRLNLVPDTNPSRLLMTELRFMIPYRMATLLLSFTLFPWRVAAHTLPDSQPADVLAVTNTSKAGLPWPNGNYVDMGQYLSTGKVQWYYTWAPSPAKANIEFVPMLWGSRQVTQWDSTINDTLSSLNVTHALGFNEPDITGQSDISPADGAALWKAHIEPLKAQGVRLGSPAPSSSPKGKQWLLDWLGACQSGCSVDFIAVHYYDINSTQFMEYLTDYHNTFQRPVWVTEWACQNFNDANAQCSQEDVVNFMNATQEFMDKTKWLERYAWFGAMENMQGVNEANALMSSQGNINALGEQYTGAVAPAVNSSYQPGVVHGGSGTNPVPSSSASKAGISSLLWILTYVIVHLNL